MTAPCQTPVSLDDFLAYRRGELDIAAEQTIETHYFTCASCAERLAWVESLEDAVVIAMRRGLFDVIVTQQSIEKLESLGSIVRKYDLGAGQAVSCTIAPGDDMTVVTLHAPSRPGVPVTLVVDLLDHTSGQQMQEQRPAFADPHTGDVIVRLAGEVQRAIGPMRVTLTLRYGEGADVETVGPFEMNHTPWPA